VKKPYSFWLIPAALALVLGLGCNKTYQVAPISPSFTPTFTPYYAGPTATSTITPSSIDPPQGFLGFPKDTSEPRVFWAGNTNPYIMDYVFYWSPDGVTYQAALTVANSNGYINVDDGITTPYDRYFYMISRGSLLPDSLPSRIVHAVSGITATDSLSLSASSGTSPTFSITGGSVPGAVNRTWQVLHDATHVYWYWGEEAALMASVNFGYSASGVLYYPGTVLPAATACTLLVNSYNSENWCIDISTLSFTTP
jgi:hypothetical protein